MTKYEYMSTNDCSIDNLNALGSEGWYWIFTEGGRMYFVREVLDAK